MQPRLDAVDGDAVGGDLASERLEEAVAPARAVFDRISCAIGWRTESDVIATTLPHRWTCIAGTAALHIATTDIRFRSSAGG